MCNKAVKKCSWSLMYVNDRYIRLQEIWYEDYSHVETKEPWLYDELITWCNGYKQHRALKK